MRKSIKIIRFEYLDISLISFTTNEEKFLKSLEECRVATCHDNLPHVKPVSYIYEDGFFYIATDYKTRMLENLKINPRVALSIDIYKSNGHKAVCIQGNVIIIENGKEFLKIYNKFYKKFDWVRNQPWKENEAPFIKVIPFKKVSWGIL
jgi:nitroimidazol reductase NimA-like FMN-containing flavoprotein (pyridoxamine 5'-phosphate oxidase superfamily)